MNSASSIRQFATLSASRRFRMLLSALWIVFAASAAPGWSAGGPGDGGMRQNQLMRQQQQDTLQLRMLQQQRASQLPPAAPRERQDLERLQINQEQRQQELQYRQGIAPSIVRPGNDSGVSRTTADQKSGEAQEQGAAQLQRFDSELTQRAETRRIEKARGEIKPPEPPAALQ